MNSITEPQTVEFIVKKSRFIGFAVPCSNESEVMTNLRAIYAEHSHANHLAFAYKVFDKQQLVTRFNDAGEPKGTAGKPILAHLEGKDLVNTLIAVIRYFGGVKLGAGGLVRAYGTTAKNVLEHCTINTYQAMATINVKIGYERMDEIQRELKNLGGRIISKDFAVQVDLVIQLPENKIDFFWNRFKPSF